MNISSAVVLFIIFWLAILLFFATSAIDSLRTGLFFIQGTNNKKELFFGIFCLIGTVFQTLSCLFIAIIPFVILFFCIK